MKTLYGLLVPVCCLIAGPALGFVSDSELLLRSYIRYSLAQEVRAQTLAVGANLENPADVEQVHVLVNEWFGSEIESMRVDLSQRFGDRARSLFEVFVNEYTTAENVGDTAYLERLSDHINLSRKPMDYPALRQMAMEQWMQTPFSEAVSLLSEIETWTVIRTRQADVPSLETWLLRDATASQTQTRPRPSVNPLAAAEAPAPEFGNATQSPASALDAFAQRRRDRREQAMQSAQAGMQQMALERQAAEEEYGARRLAEAEAEAEAMRVQAQRLAASEAEAIAQRENSWGNRIKRVVGGTLTAGLGAFTGGIGAEAGSRAAAEMFR